MSSYQIPLRRAKQEDNEKFEASQDAQAEDEAREAVAKERRLAQIEANEACPELQIWLKDFP